MAKAKASTPDQSAPVAYLVTSQVEGFRRAGRAWSREATRIEAADLQDGQLEALQAEPMLDVVGVAE